MSKTVGLDGKPVQANINIKPEDLKDIVCENCECHYFQEVHAFKRVSALISPTGREQIIPIPIYRCSECGFINEEFRIMTNE